MRTPTERELAEIAADLDITFGAGESEKFAELVAQSLVLLEDVEKMPTPQLAPRDFEYGNRGPGYQPDDEEDPYNAWITKCEVVGANDGPLNGLTVGLKDNISLAGIELTNGSDVMQGYVPAADATVVTRLLDAGATILGKNNMWSFSLGPSDYGPAKNPTAPGRSIGGSSSGTASAVAAGEVDIGMGGDQAGSVRIPASFSGLVGMKATHGLIPYTGIFGADPTQDHTGPLTRTVTEAAQATEVLAGRDGFDPRQPHDLSVDTYTDALDEDVSNMSIGVLKEGFEHEENDPEVNEVVREAVADLEELGVDVTEVSVPRHLDSRALHMALGGYGVGQVLQQNAIGVGFQGWYDTNAMEFLGRAFDSNFSDLPNSLLVSVLTSEYLKRNYHGALYGKAQNLTLKIREQYDEVLADVDALVAPTIPITPPTYGDIRSLDTLLESNDRDAVIANTAMFDLTHHPAMTVPCGTADGAPVGMMLVGEHFDESTLFNLGYAYEQQQSA